MRSWAAASAPGSAEADYSVTAPTVAPSPPWVVFGALGALPLVDFGLRRIVPIAASLEGFRDVSMVITIFSVLPLLIARLAVENSGARQADHRRLLLAAATEHADDLISIMTPTGQIETPTARSVTHWGGSREVSLRPATESLPKNRARSWTRSGPRPDCPCVAWHVGAPAQGRIRLRFSRPEASPPSRTDGLVTNFAAVESGRHTKRSFGTSWFTASDSRRGRAPVSGVAPRLNPLAVDRRLHRPVDCRRMPAECAWRSGGDPLRRSSCRQDRAESARLRPSLVGRTNHGESQCDRPAYDCAQAIRAGYDRLRAGGDVRRGSAAGAGES